MKDRNYTLGQRLTENEKKANDYQWYKDQIDNAIGIYDDNVYPIVINDEDNDAGEFFKSDRYRDMRINYDLYDGKIRREDFKYIYSPYGIEDDSPVDFNNKDIISKRINAVDGLERQRQFSYRLTAINPEATSRREQEETERIREYIVEQIMKPIREQLQQQAQQQMQEIQMRMQNAQSEEEARQLQEEMNQAQQQIQQQMQQQEEVMTPEEVKQYMQRDHQDPADVLGNQILNYVRYDQDVKEKWNLINKDFCCVGRAIAYVGERCKKTTFERVNPMGFNFMRSTSSHYIEDSEWCSYERYLNPSEIEMEFGDELTTSEIRDLFDRYTLGEDDYVYTFRRDMYTNVGIRVVHVEWKDSKRIGFLTYTDPETGEEMETIVSDGYRLDKETGDISIRWEWIVCVYEGYKIGADKYVRMRERPGQFNDLSNLNNREKCKLSYKGVWVDVSLIDRMKPYQFLYSIIWYRIEMLMARDKGKTVAMDTNMIDSKLGIDKFLDYMENTGIMFFSKSQEGDRGVPFNIGESVKEINRSLGSDMQQYQQLAEYIDQKCGESVGINQQIIGDVHRNESVGNAQMAMSNGITVLEHHFDMFNHFKESCLMALIETAKYVFMKYQPDTIHYVLDDFSIQMLSIDYDLLDESTYGITIGNSAKASQTLDTIVQLIQPAMQNQAIEMSDVIKILKAESIQEAEELLLKAEENRRKYQEQQMQQQQEGNEKIEQMKLEQKMQEIQTTAQAKMEQIRLQGEIDMKLKEMDLQRQALLALGFDTDKDRNNNNVPDVIDQMKLMLEELKAKQKDREIDIKERQQINAENDSQRRHDEAMKRLEIEKKKLNSNKK